MAIEEPEQAGVPEWVVTFGDMMSLLLTFFIMLISMSEIKQQERFQAMAESMRRRFGHESAMLSQVPGRNRPQSAKLAHIAAMGRARRLDTMRGGDRVRAPVGESPRVQQIRQSQDPTQGGAIYFAEGSAELTEAAKERLQEIAERMKGKPQKIEVRGHTTTRPLAPDSPFHNHWELAFARCCATVEYLVELGIDRKRLTIGVAGENEPIETSEDPEKLRRNARVEIYMLNELAEGLTPPSSRNPQKSPAADSP